MAEITSNDKKRPYSLSKQDDGTKRVCTNPEKATRIKVAIIGTAGRKGLDAKMSKNMFEQMIQMAETVIVDEWKLAWSQIQLVSGGAAWSDHVAPKLFMAHWEESAELKLFLPCPLVVNDKNQSMFRDTNDKDWRKNPGRTANLYHTKFAKALGMAYPTDTIKEIDTAVKMGAEIDSDGKGFFERDLKVGQCDYLLAFSWDDGPVPTSGGTGHTWKHSSALKKRHVNLSTLSVVFK